MKFPAIFSLSFVLWLLLILFSLLSLRIGSVPVTWEDFLNDPTAQLIFLELRVPRTLIAIFVGAGLGCAGALLQGRLQNPLADAGLIGSSSAAALGAALCIHSGLYLLSPLFLPIVSAISAAVAACAVFYLAGRGAGSLTVILAGAAIQSLTGALTALTLNLAPSPHAALEISFWMLGSVTDKSLTEVGMIAPFLACGLYYAAHCRTALNALSLGEETAISLGVNMRSLNYRVLLAVTLCVGSVTAVAGTVGFVGLAVPHILRRYVGSYPGALLFPSALGGAILTLAADILTRVAPTSSELKLGVVTSLIGAPFFIHILIRHRGKFTL